MRICISGVAGFIGSYIAEQFSKNHEIVGLDYLHATTTGAVENIPESVEYYDCDLATVSIGELEAVLDGCDALLHIGGVSTLDVAQNDPVQAYRVNAVGSCKIFKAAAETTVDRVVAISTSSIYGTHSDGKGEYANYLEASTHYEASKLSLEHIAEVFQTDCEMEMSVVRPYSIYGGPRWESHKGGYANIVTQLCEAVDADDTFAVYGDGSQTRDFVHIFDFTRAIDHILQTGASGKFNIGRGSPLSFNEVVDVVCEVFDSPRDAAVEFVENPIDEDKYVGAQFADYSRLRDETGWEPVVDFEDGVASIARQFS